MCELERIDEDSCNEAVLPWNPPFFKQTPGLPRSVQVIGILGTNLRIISSVFDFFER